MRLTDAGRLLSQLARVLLSAAEAASADLASVAGAVRGTVRAGGLCQSRPSDTSACGPSGLFSEEHDVAQRQMRGNLPQAFVHVSR